MLVWPAWLGGHPATLLGRSLHAATRWTLPRLVGIRIGGSALSGVDRRAGCAIPRICIRQMIASCCTCSFTGSFSRQSRHLALLEAYPKHHRQALHDSWNGGCLQACMTCFREPRLVPFRCFMWQSTPTCGRGILQTCMVPCALCLRKQASFFVGFKCFASSASARPQVKRAHELLGRRGEAGSTKFFLCQQTTEIPWRTRNFTKQLQRKDVVQETLTTSATAEANYLGL